ncbi:uncharacterized protein LOC129776972 [Toxorhynchites rutilus septentrionalis]|uniref:uncharacterized protein LOC129776972 n=1 Tax=Toxorhynchites rutilus septentrionalis TaxID=329112 RepID=UPI0024796A9E|nr:uncharacterized protein LOC129776972 [Toxorhynchites rutilus septentrionalis]
MSLNFGEIIEPSTRAFWDEYDENDEDRSPLEPLQWEWLNEDGTEEKLDQVKLLLVLEGQGISDFVATAVLKGGLPICRLNHGAVNIYYDSQSGLLVCSSEEKDLNLFSLITDKLAMWLDIAEQVVAIAFHPKVMHKGTPITDAEEVCFIRRINGQMTRYQELEAPNVITGISAGVLCYRKFKQLEASVYACYMDSPILDSVSTKPVLELMKSLSIDCDNSYSLKNRISSNLYL